MEISGLASCLKCCECGEPIEYNPSNLCDNCLRSLVDITKLIPSKCVIQHCFTCSRFLSPPSTWVSEHNKDQVLKLCLRNLSILHRYNVKNARFLYTEPHSKRLKVEIEVSQSFDQICGSNTVGSTDTDIQQTVEVEFVMTPHHCDNCARDAAKDYWNASVQVRQKATVKTTLLYLEQILIKANAHHQTVNIKHVKGGIDFFFKSRGDAIQMVNFFRGKLPIRVDDSKKLLSQDDKSNTFNYKYTFLVELPPLCKNDIVVLSKKFAQKLGNMSQICIVSRIQEMIHLIDPVSARVRSIDCNTFFSNPFKPIATFKNLSRFIVMDINKCPPSKPRPGENPLSKLHFPAEAYVCSVADLGTGGDVHVRTHLGDVLKPNDMVLGIDLRSLNCNNEVLDSIKADMLPDIILVKKYYERTKRHTKRAWHLKKIQTDDGASVGTTEGEDRAEFMENLEEDKDLRDAVNLYHDTTKVARQTTELEDDEDDDEAPEVPLDELMDMLKIEDVEMAE